MIWGEVANGDGRSMIENFTQKCWAIVCRTVTRPLDLIRLWLSWLIALAVPKSEQKQIQHAEWRQSLPKRLIRFEFC